VSLADWIPQHLYFLGEYEEPEILFLEKTLRPGDVFIDGGANIGLFTLVASRAVGDAGKIFAFEAAKENFERLSYQLQLNGCKNVNALHLALSDSPGQIEIKIHQKNNNSGMTGAYLDVYSSSELTPATSLDDFVATAGLTELALIKLDIEGGEFRAVKGMVKTLEKFRPVLMVEFEPALLKRAGHSIEELEQLILASGYEKFFLDRSGNLARDSKQGIPTTNVVFQPLPIQQG
jgi:FkbM family methyltransferase